MKKCEPSSSVQSSSNEIDDEYALFMVKIISFCRICFHRIIFQAEIEKEGTLASNESNINAEDLDNEIDDELKAIEGMKCRAPHIHQWGDIVYHNAIVCSVIPRENNDYNNIEVRTLLFKCSPIIFI